MFEAILQVHMRNPNL